MISNRYRIEIYNGSGQLIADVSDYATSRSITFTRNSADLIDITFDASKIEEMCLAAHIDFWNDLFVKNVNEIRFWRDDKVISAGQLDYTSVQIQDVGITISTKAVGWFELLKDRYLLGDTAFNEDAGQIAWDSINTSQTNPAYLNPDSTNDADFGIRQGNLVPSMVRVRNYTDKCIKDLIVQEAGVVNGFDFEITWDKKFNVFYPKMGIKRDDIVFSFPGNVQQLRIDGDGTQVANEIEVFGSGSGVNKVSSQVYDRASITNRKLRQSIQVYSDITVPQTLTDHGNGTLAYSAAAFDTLSLVCDGRVDPIFGTYNLGDEVQVITDNQMALKPVNNTWRIDQMILDIDENNKETVTIKVMR